MQRRKKRGTGGGFEFFYDVVWCFLDVFYAFVVIFVGVLLVYW
jgi:hypothetical protein